MGGVGGGEWTLNFLFSILEPTTEAEVYDSSLYLLRLKSNIRISLSQFD